MTGLVKAYLAEITSGNSPTEVNGTKVNVQFNPTSLRVQISNRTAGGQQAGAQARQRPGTGEMQVNFDLVFDSADEGTTEDGVSVLEKTKMVERFVRPRSAQPGQEAPPRVVFVWGTFTVQGIMDSANIDIDLFDEKGVPLRARVSVAIKGQDPHWAYTPAPSTNGPPAQAGNATRPDAGTSLPPGAPGTQGSGLVPDRILQAMPGESLAQLASRAGLDPSAWRAMADSATNPLKLETGQEIPLPANAGSGSATGTAGQGSEPAKTTTSLPMVNANQTVASGDGASSAAARAIAGDPVQQGQAVASRGGLQKTISQLKDAAHQQGASNSLAAFGIAGGVSAEASDRPWGVGVPLRPRFGGSQRPTPSPNALASVTPLKASRLAGRGGNCGCSACGGSKKH